MEHPKSSVTVATLFQSVKQSRSISISREAPPMIAEKMVFVLAKYNFCASSTASFRAVMLIPVGIDSGAVRISSGTEFKKSFACAMSSENPLMPRARDSWIRMGLLCDEVWGQGHGPQTHHIDFPFVHEAKVNFKINCVPGNILILDSSIVKKSKIRSNGPSLTCPLFPPYTGPPPNVSFTQNISMSPTPCILSVQKNWRSGPASPLWTRAAMNVLALRICNQFCTENLKILEQSAGSMKSSRYFTSLQSFVEISEFHHFW